MASPEKSLAAAGAPPDLVAICEKAIGILVESFGYPEAEARQRLNLWRARQHDLEGQALEAILPSISPADKDSALVRWALEGLFLEKDLRASAAQLGTPLRE